MTSRDVEAAAVRSTEELAADADAPVEIELHDDRTRETRTPSFRRMNTSVHWSDPDAAVVTGMLGMVENLIMMEFADAFQMMNRIWDKVRQPVTDDQGTVQLDRFGYPLWARTSDGGYVEDFSLLNKDDRENLIFVIHTHLVEWEQRSAQLHGEAMLAKVAWEESYSRAFQTPTGRVTEADRTAHGKVDSMEERHRAIFRSMISRHAEALIRSISLLGQRLKDSLDW